MLRISKLFLILTIPLFFGGCTVSKPQANTAVDSFPQEKIEGLAQALTAASAKMYGSRFCTTCQHQKEMFGDNWSKINFVECASGEDNPARNQACTAAQIELYPTWEFNDGSRMEGIQSFKALAQKIGFVF